MYESGTDAGRRIVSIVATRGAEQLKVDGSNVTAPGNIGLGSGLTFAMGAEGDAETVTETRVPIPSA